MKQAHSLIIGTRASPLAQLQGRLIKKTIEKSGFKGSISFVHFETKGDRLLDVPLQGFGGKGLFTMEIERALSNGAIDLAVHSLKDMALQSPDDLTVCAYSKREDPRDCFISPHFSLMSQIPSGGIIGTASLRRQAFLAHLNPGLAFTLIRGNVETRLAKVVTENMAGTILSYAGLKRLGLEVHAQELLSLETMVPAPGQGVLAVQCRKDRTDLCALGNAITVPEVALCVQAERTVLDVLGGNCHTPLGAYCVLEGGQLKLHVKLGHPSGQCIFSAIEQGPAHNPHAVGMMAAKEILKNLPQGLPAWLKASPAE